MLLRDSMESTTTSTTNSATVGSDPEKVRQIRQQLVLILHAKQCQQRGVESDCRALPLCAVARDVITHMKTCTAGMSCPVPHCVSSRQIIGHWIRCVRTDTACGVCSPLKERIRMTRMNKNVSTLTTPAHSDPQWRSGLTVELRTRLIERIVSALILNQELSGRRLNRSDQLLIYGWKEESIMFESSNSLEMYFQLMAQLMCKIHQQLEQRSYSRLESEPNQLVTNIEPIEGYDCLVLDSTDQLTNGFDLMVLN